MEIKFLFLYTENGLIYMLVLELLWTVAHHAETFLLLNTYLHLFWEQEIWKSSSFKKLIMQ